MMRKLGFGLYALVAYLLFLASLAWAVLFLANGPAPRTVDHAPPGPLPLALALDLTLLGLFALQHSVMARKGFKRQWTRIVPAAAERSTYVALASLVLLVTFGQWRAIPGTVWDLDGTISAPMAWALFWAGWITVIAATFMVDHFDFFGVRRAYADLLQRAYRPGTFQERWLYAWVRHPMMLGLLVAFWATPRMTTGHLLFAAAASGYIAVGVTLEERDLRRELGEVYRDYARRVPAIIPWRRREAAPAMVPGTD